MDDVDVNTSLERRLAQAEENVRELHADRRHLEQELIRRTAEAIRIRESLDKFAHADPASIQQVASALLELSNSYYVSARQQSQRSFWFALVAAGIGLCFLIAAYWFTDKAYLSLGSGLLMELLSGVIFTLYGRTSSQLAVFHKSMDRMQRFLIAYSMTGGLEGDVRQQARAELVKTVSMVDIEK